MPKARITSFAASVAAIVLAAAGPSGGTTFNLVKVVDENTAIPGGEGTFTGFFPVSISRDPITGFAKVCFLANGVFQQGVYLFDEQGGTLELVADKDTPVPEGSGNFTSFGSCAVSGDNVAIEAGGFNQDGVYLAGEGGIVQVADRNTPIPSGGGTFTHLDFVSVDGDDVAFRATGPDIGNGLQHGIYARVDGVLYRSVDRNTAIPDGVGNFTETFGRPTLDSGQVSYTGRGSSSQSGIYVSPATGGPAVLVADESTQTPGRFSNFTGFGEPSIDAGSVSFSAGSSSHSGVYTDLGGQLRVVADEDTTVPAYGGKFSGFGRTSISGGNVALYGQSVGPYGLYLAFSAGSTGSTLVKVVDNEDTIDGRAIRLPDFWRHGLDGASVAFEIAFKDDDTEAIYLANVAPLSMDPAEVNLVDPANASNQFRIELRGSTLVPTISTELVFEVGGEVGSQMVASDIALDFDSPVSLVEVTSDGDWSASSVTIGANPLDVELDLQGDADAEIIAPLRLEVVFIDAPSRVSFQCCMGAGDTVETQLVPEPAATTRVLSIVAVFAVLASRARRRRDAFEI